MKSLTQRFCALFVCLSLLAAFSIPVYAEQVEVPEYTIRQTAWVEWEGGKTTAKQFTFNPNDDIEEKQDVLLGTVPANKKATYVNTILYDAVDTVPLFRKGSELDTAMYDVFFGSTRIFSSGSMQTSYKVTSARLLLFYADGSAEYINVEEHLSNEHNNIDVFAFLPAEFSDIESFELQLYQELDSKSSQYNVDALLGEYNQAKFNLTVERSSEEAGLLQGIIEWLTAIRDWIVTLAGKVNSILNSITELPGVIWEYFSDGLKSLFIPDEYAMSELTNQLQDIFITRFGALAQIIELTFGVWGDIQLNDAEDTITIPEVTINLPENSDFTFGGQSVKIVPTGFEFMADSLKIIVGIVCTYLYVGGLRRRYDEVMGVEQ